MKRLIQRLITLLSHPMWNSLNCLITFVVGFGLTGAIIAGAFALSRQLQLLVDFLIAPVAITRIVLITGSLLIAWYLLTTARSTLLRLRPAPTVSTPLTKRVGKYWKFWGVLWQRFPRMWESDIVAGPFCPTHYLPMEVKFEEDTYSFNCHGGEGNPPHTISGPPIRSLMAPNERIYDFPEYLRNDVREQIAAELRKLEG
jgi:hypothetical protein